MTILAIGQSSFLLKEVKKLPFSKGWVFLSHTEALNKDKWPDDITVVVGFACNPKVREGRFSNFDHKLAKIAQGFGAFYIMLSSRAVYGMTDQSCIFKEDQEPYPEITPYGQAKKEIEDDLLKSFDNVIILRLSNVFGLEYDSQNHRQTFFGLMLKSLKEEGKISFSMSHQTYRDFLPASIFGDYLAAIVQNPQSGVYNLGSGIGIPAGDIAQWVIEGYGAGVVEPNDKTIIDSAVLDMTKTFCVFGIKQPTKAEISQMCIEIGRKLKLA